MILVDIYVHMAVDGVRVRDLIVKHVSRLRPWRNCQKRLQLARHVVGRLLLLFVPFRNDHT